MAIPVLFEITLPLLQILADGQEYPVATIKEKLAAHFHLTQAEREQTLPSGANRVFDNRMAWARVDLQLAKIITSPSRGIVKITPRGIDVLQNLPTKIDRKFLTQFPEYNNARKRTTGAETTQATMTTLDVIEKQALDFQQSPNEVLERIYNEIQASLASLVIERVLQISPARFERLVVELLVKMGYGGTLPDAGKMTKLSGDEGIDGVIKEDKLGLDMIYLQAKRWKDSSVGRPEIQKFVGALAGQKAQKGVFITTSFFSKEAREYAANLQQKVVLIDGEQLAELMIEYDLGVSVAQTYLIKRVDNDYFDDNID